MSRFSRCGEALFSHSGEPRLLVGDRHAGQSRNPSLFSPRSYYAVNIKCDPVFADLVDCYSTTLIFACVFFFYSMFKARVNISTLPLKSHLISLVAMEDLAKDFARCFTTRQAEEEEIPVDDDPIPFPTKHGSHNLIGRVVSQKIFSGLSLKMNIIRLLLPVRGFTFQDLGHNRFILKFNHPLDLELAMEGSPWLIDRWALLLQPWDKDRDTLQTEVNLMTIVVRVHNIPTPNQTEKVVERIGVSLGDFVGHVTSKRDEFQDFVRIKVILDVTKALKQGSFLLLGDGSKTWVAFKYERMPLYGYLCGLVGT